MSLRVTIDERPLVVEKGATIMQAARQNGIYIPHLCDVPGLPSHGSCRMCIVDVQGRQNTPTACTTPVEEGMVVRTNTPQVQGLREQLLQMLLSEHPCACLVCPERNHCDECMVTLRKAGVTTGCRSCPKDGQCPIQEMVARIGVTRVDYPIHYRMLPVERQDPFFDRDYNLCVLCGRCIRVCSDLHFASTLAFTNRGTDTVVGTSFHRTHREAGCHFCGSCVEVCPTGALSEKTRKWDGQPEGETASTCPLCSIACQITLLTKDSTVIGSLPNHSMGTDELCVKGRFGITELVNHPTRLKEPQKLVDDRHVAIPWDEIIRIAAEKLSACPPDKFGMILSTSCTNEDMYIANKFVRDVMESGNVQSHAAALYADGFNTVEELIRKSEPLTVIPSASTILCLGFDGKYSQSVVEVKLHQARKAGARIITVNSQAHSLSRFADEWLQPEPGREIDHIEKLFASIRRGTSSLVSHPTDAAPVDPIERAARLLCASDDLVVIVGPSFLVHPHSPALLKSVEKLVLALGARMVILPEQGNLAGSILLSSSAGSLNLTEQELDVLYVVGESIPVNLPGHPFILYQNIYPPSTGQKADLILPAAAFTEEDGAYIDCSGSIREIRQAVPPPGNALPAWKILAMIAREMGVQGFDYPTVDAVQAEITAVFENIMGTYRVDPSSVSETLALPGDDGHAPHKQGNGRGNIRCDFSGSPKNAEHEYMGFPLTQFVDGLKALYPDETN